MKELLIKLRTRIQKNGYIDRGLCHEVAQLVISRQDFYRLIDYIHSHRPRSGKHFDKKCEISCYYWPINHFQPRMDWLNDIIKRFK